MSGWLRQAFQVWGSLSVVFDLSLRSMMNLSQSIPISVMQQGWEWMESETNDEWHVAKGLVRNGETFAFIFGPTTDDCFLHPPYAPCVFILLLFNPLIFSHSGVYKGYGTINGSNHLILVILVTMLSSAQKMIWKKVIDQSYLPIIPPNGKHEKGPLLV